MSLAHLSLKQPSGAKIHKVLILIVGVSILTMKMGTRALYSHIRKGTQVPIIPVF